jgi:hypothetical protein
MRSERRQRLLAVVTSAIVSLLSLLGAAWFAAGALGWHYCTDFSRRGDNYYMRCYEPRPSGPVAVALAVLGFGALALAIRRGRAG